MGDKFVYKIKEGVLAEGEELTVNGLGVFKAEDKIESDEPVFNQNLELVSSPEKTDKKVGVVPRTEAKE